MSLWCILLLVSAIKKDINSMITVLRNTTCEQTLKTCAVCICIQFNLSFYQTVPSLNPERLEQLKSRSASASAYILAACLHTPSPSIHKGPLIVIRHPVLTDLDCFPCLIDDEVKHVRSIHSLSGALSPV